MNNSVVNEMNESDAQNVLKYLVKDGKVDLSDIREKMEMSKRAEILRKHPYRISEGKDGYFRTYLPDPTRKDKRRLIKKKYRKAVEDEIIAYWKNTRECTFLHYYNSWVEQQKKYGIVNNTLVRYESDYRRFFQGTEFEKMDINNITEEDITAFMIQTVKRLNLKVRAGNALWGYIAGIFKHAKIQKAIQSNPCEYVEKRNFTRFYDRVPQPVETRTMNDHDLHLFMEALHLWEREKPEYIPCYAVELAVYTGMRVGELAALTWKNIHYEEGYIRIALSEKTDKKTGIRSVEGTKTGKERRFPLTDAIEELLKRVRKAEMKCGFLGDYVFQDANGRISTRTITNCCRRRCDTAGIERKSIHALRRTFNSNMKIAGASTVVAASLLGHTEQVNESNYTYDTSSEADKKRLVTKVGELAL